MRPTYFWHIPKTAGTSVTAAVTTALKEQIVYPGNTLDVLWASEAPPAAEYDLFCGHFASYLTPLLDEAPSITFTVLRDPVERAWSYYRFLQRIPEFDRPGGVQGQPLEALLDDPVFSRLFTNAQARWLAFDVQPSAWHSTPAISSFIHQSAFELQDLTAHGATPTLHERAVKRLEAMTAVGTADRLEGLFAQLADRGLPVPWAGQRLNADPVVEKIPPALRRRLETVNDLDRDLFERARSAS